MVMTLPDLASSSDHSMVSPSPLHGKVGTPALWATMEDAILSPSDHMAFSGGPAEENSKEGQN